MCHWHSQQGMHGYLLRKRFVLHQLDKKDRTRVWLSMTIMTTLKSTVPPLLYWITSTSGGVCSVLVPDLILCLFSSRNRRLDMKIYENGGSASEIEKQDHIDLSLIIWFLMFSHINPYFKTQIHYFKTSFSPNHYLGKSKTLDSWLFNLRSLFVKPHCFLTDVLTEKSLRYLFHLALSCGWPVTVKYTRCMVHEWYCMVYWWTRGLLSWICKAIVMIHDDSSRTVKMQCKIVSKILSNVKCFI